MLPVSNDSFTTAASPQSPPGGAGRGRRRPTMGLDVSDIERSHCSVMAAAVEIDHFVAAHRGYAASLRQLYSPSPGALAVTSPLRVVGRPISQEDQALCAMAKAAIEGSKNETLCPGIREQLGIKHLTRGTYLIRAMDSQTAILMNDLATTGALASGESLLTDPRIQSSPLILPNCEELIGETELSGASLLARLLRLNVRTVAVFKPHDEVRGMPNYEDPRPITAKEGIDPSNEIPNEVIVAGLRNLDIASIETSLTGHFYVRGEGRTTSVTKVGALMPFVPSSTDLLQIQEDDLKRIIRDLPLQTVQELAITDLGYCNTDRTMGNILYSPETGRIHFIDNALVLPAGFLSGAIFAWMSWPQALLPFTEESLAKIDAMDFRADLDKIQATYPDYPAENIETMHISYYLLKKGAAAGLSPFQIALCLLRNSDFPGSPMHHFYTDAKAEAGALDPEAIFEAMTGKIDKVIVRLADAFPKLLEETRAKLSIDDPKFEEKLIHALEAEVSSWKI